MNPRGFKQVEGQHYNGMTISSAVTNSATIITVLMLKIMASMLAHVVDVKGAFSHGEFEDGEIIHTKVTQGFEKHFPEGIMDLSRQQKSFGDSCCVLQVPWDSSKAQQISAFTINGWADYLP
jgi:hypothetical protein